MPTPIKSIFKMPGFSKLFSTFGVKYITELSFQTRWAEEFKENKSKVLEYWQRYRYLEEINKICEIQNNTRILDVGCGISTILHFLDGEKYGIDPLADEYQKLYNYPPEINIQKGFGENIPFADEYFDIVFCSNALDHVTDPEKTINEIYRVLKTGGYFVLTVEIFPRKTARNLAHPHSLTKKDIDLLLNNIIQNSI